jgi:hypothetical protein
MPHDEEPSPNWPVPVEITPTPATGQLGAGFPGPARLVTRAAHPSSVAHSGRLTRSADTPSAIGVFRNRRRVRRLAEENAELRARLSTLQGMDETERAAEATAVAAAHEALRRDRDAAEQQLSIITSQLGLARRDLADLRAQIVEFEDVASLQEVGVYQHRHPLDDAAGYQSRLAEIRHAIKAMTRSGQAVQAPTNWTVNGSLRASASAVRDVAKLMLRAYNAEADTCVHTLRSHTLASAVARLEQVRRMITRLCVDVRVNDSYHLLRLSELELTAAYLATLAEERPGPANPAGLPGCA